MEKLTLTQILTELKMLDKRIEKKINESKFCEILVGEQLLNKRNKQEVTTEIKSNFQSIKDLIDRRLKLKSLLNQANATTKVTIADKKMTIAEAIDLKTSINHSQMLLNKLKSEKRNADLAVAQQNEKVNIQISQMKTEENNKTSNDFIESYMKQFGASLFDILKIDTEINNLEDYIDKFTCEVDFKLSEINALTSIEF